jgi:PadR family transcriptional regulator, regulatory protein PadR
VSSGELREPTFLVLVALAAERLHGYGVMQGVAELSEGRVRLGPGTVYGVLDRLERDGLVAEDGVEIEQGRERRYFRITSAGAAALGAETERLASNVRVARARIRRARLAIEQP